MKTLSQIPKISWSIRLAIIAFWLSFFLLVIVFSYYLPFVLKGKEWTASGVISSAFPWIAWLGLTFLVIRWARCFPFKKGLFKQSLFRHLLLGVVIALMHGMVEYGLIYLWAVIRGCDVNVSVVLLVILIRRLPVSLFVYWMILSATTAYDYYGKYRASELASSQLEAKLAQSQLHALKMQLHPHFLFNTHHSIISLMLHGKTDAAMNMLTRLSDLLRLTLDKTNQQLTSLKEEMDVLDLYLSIQKERFSERLEIHMNVNPELMNAEIPYLLLQPLVENALKHGVDDLVTGGEVTISAKREEDSLYLSVKDNGLGMLAEETEENGIGLQNTKIRLERLYGKAQKMEIVSTKFEGTEVRLRLPYRIYRPSKINPTTDENS